jgi:hypothetical protein
MQSRFSKPLPASGGPQGPEPLPEEQAKALDEMVRRFRDANARNDAAQAERRDATLGSITDPTVRRGARGER